MGTSLGVYLSKQEGDMDMSEENIDNKRDKHLQPVTVIVKRIAKKNKIKEFEEWLSGVSKEVSRQNGSMGIDIIRPTDNESKPEYVIIFRFDTYDNMMKWENSSVRNRWLQKGRELVQSDPDVQKLSGLEFWFTPYSKENSHSMPLNSPRRYKMVIVTIPVIAALLLTLVPQIHFITESLSIPYSIRFVIATAIMVLLMTYFIMPLLTRVLRPWLFSN
jgi:antibiotic biosynthesis monooxygenase (ABM) superfamily enzyme